MRDELLNETLFYGIDHARDAVAHWTHTRNTERPHSTLGYQAPAIVAAQLTAMVDQLRATETLRRSTIAPSAQPRQIQPPNLVLDGLASGVTAVSAPDATATRSFPAQTFQLLMNDRADLRVARCSDCGIKAL